MSARGTMNQLRRQLDGLGFQLALVSPAEHSWTFSRPHNDVLYEWISCYFVGKQNEAAVCRIGASVTRIVPVKGLTEMEVLTEVAQVPDRGWTVTDDEEKLNAWQESVVKMAVPRVRDYADARSKSLMLRTERVRRSARDCLDQLESLGPHLMAYKELQKRASDAQIHVAERLAEWPGVQLVAGCEQEYKLASLAVVVLLRSHHLPSVNNPDEMPLENEQLMWEIQLIADGLIAARMN